MTIHEEIKAQFDVMVKAGNKIYLSKDPGIKQRLIAEKISAKIRNKDVQPYINDHDPHKCLTCGTINRAHPVTSFCIVCDTDNWTRYIKS